MYIALISPPTRPAAAKAVADKLSAAVIAGGRGGHVETVYIDMMDGPARAKVTGASDQGLNEEGEAERAAGGR